MKRRLFSFYQFVCWEKIIAIKHLLILSDIKLIHLLLQDIEEFSNLYFCNPFFSEIINLFNLFFFYLFVTCCSEQVLNVDIYNSLLTSVKNQLIVAISENTPKIFSNFKLILDLMQVNELIDKLILSFDMKLANIFCGTQSHSSKHPCC